MSLDLLIILATALIAAVGASVVVATWPNKASDGPVGRNRPFMARLLAGDVQAEHLGADAFGVYDSAARTLTRIVCVAAAAFLALVVFGHPLAMLAGLPLGLLGAHLLISRADAAQRRALDSQLPEAIDQLVSLVRGKHSLESSMKVLADSGPRAMVPVFARVANREALVAPLDEALQAVANETVNRHIQLLFAALAVFCREGGNAIEPLQRMSTTFKQIMRLSEKIDTAAAQAWGTFRTINYAAIAIILIIYVSQPQLLLVLSTTGVGIVLTIACGVIWVSGLLLMRNAMKILI